MTASVGLSSRVLQFWHRCTSKITLFREEGFLTRSFVDIPISGEETANKCRSILWQCLLIYSSVWKYTFIYNVRVPSPVIDVLQCKNWRTLIPPPPLPGCIDKVPLCVTLLCWARTLSIVLSSSLNFDILNSFTTRAAESYRAPHTSSGVGGAGRCPVCNIGGRWC